MDESGKTQAALSFLDPGVHERKCGGPGSAGDVTLWIGVLAAVTEPEFSFRHPQWELTTTYHSSSKESGVLFQHPQGLHPQGAHVYTQANTHKHLRINKILL